MTRLLLALVAVIAFGCEAKSGDKPSKPTGTPTDPVDVCERLADVCRYKGSQLGVCITPGEGKAASCEGRTPCYVCAPQH